MRKIGIVVLLMLSSAFVAGAKAKKIVLTTAKDSASYAIGIEFAKSVKENMAHLPGGPYDEKLALEAFSKIFMNDTLELSISQNKTGEFLQTYMRTAQELEAEKAKAEGIAFLANNKKKPTVVETASGLQYEVLKEGNGIKPAATDKVKVHYHGTLIDGTVFDSSVERGEPITFELNKVIPGWTEGLQLMSIGSKYRFYIPQELGYGARGTGSIRPYSVLIFDVELLDVGKATPAQQPASNGAKYQFKQYQRTGK